MANTPVVSKIPINTPTTIPAISPDGREDEFPEAGGFQVNRIILSFTYKRFR